MAKRKMSDTQIVCIILLWVLLCYLLLRYSVRIDTYVIFVIIVSGVLVFVPIYKSRRRPKN